MFASSVGSESVSTTCADPSPDGTTVLAAASARVCNAESACWCNTLPSTTSNPAMSRTSQQAITSTPNADTRPRRVRAPWRSDKLVPDATRGADGVLGADLGQLASQTRD